MAGHGRLAVHDGATVIEPKVIWVRQTAQRTLKSGVVVNPLEGSVAMLSGLVSEDIPGGIAMGVQRAGEAMEAYAKATAPWTDRTGAARAGLRGYGGMSRTGCWCAAVQHAPDVHYGVWLETRWNGRYAVVAPTQEAFADKIVDVMRESIRVVTTGGGKKGTAALVEA